MKKSNSCTIKRLRFILCVDYRALNANMAIPTGNLIEVVESMAGAKFFSTIDLAHGYFQIPIAEDALSHKNGIQPDAFRFERSPCYVRKDDECCSRPPYAAQLVLYMDDLCILSDTFEVHLERLECTSSAAWSSAAWSSDE